MSFISVFDMFKIGPGPSSSHTYGPMVATARFLDKIREHAAENELPEDTNITIELRGSLSSTGVGHATDKAVIWGLLGFKPDTMPPDEIELKTKNLDKTKYLITEGLPAIRFDPENDIIFNDEALPEHPNGMIVKLQDSNGRDIVNETYFSVGGGFVETKAELEGEEKLKAGNDNEKTLPYAFNTAAELIEMCEANNMTIAQIVEANELVHRTPDEIRDGIAAIWNVMNDCVDRGLEAEGHLPGGLGEDGLGLKRIAKEQYQRHLTTNEKRHSLEVGIYARAVNEENAAGGQVVTAPTNGAAGIVPAVLRHYIVHLQDDPTFTINPEDIEKAVKDYLLTAAAIGQIVKKNAFISGAAGGCQAEIGSASAMAAGALTAIWGSSPKRTTLAASAALEAHLGQTCDPVKGLVQMPCIRRNVHGAPKALQAANDGYNGDLDGQIIPLDECIETMRQTGEDMNDKYKETAAGGLATNYPLAECNAC